jgi:hypothetical protein
MSVDMADDYDESLIGNMITEEMPSFELFSNYFLARVYNICFCKRMLFKFFKIF